MNCRKFSHLPPKMEKNLLEAPSFDRTLYSMPLVVQKKIE
jgi:hypothetical protein